MCELGDINGHRLLGQYTFVLCAPQLAYPQGVLISGQ